MNIVMSLWTKPCTDGKAHGFRTIEEMVDSLVLSCNVAKKHYENIILYTDKLGYEWITPRLDQLPFSKIEVCLDEMNWLDDKYWSLCKVYVYSLQKEPFIHIDNDVYLWDPFPQNLLENDFFFQEIEPFTSHKFYLDALDVYTEVIPKEIKVSDGAFNCGVFACLTQKALDIIPSYYESGFSFVKSTNFSEKVKMFERGPDSRWIATVIIEQVFIYSLVVESKEYKWDVFLYPKYYKFKYSHTLAHHKRNGIIANKVKERIKFKDWEG